MARNKHGRPTTNGHVTTSNPILREPPPGAPRSMTMEEVTLNRWEKIVNNVTTLQRGFMQQFLDRRKDVDAECGYPSDTAYAAQSYQQLFDREPVANRVVQLLPKESWQVQPLVYEDEDPNVVTPFEQAWDDLARQLRGGSMYQDEEGNPIWEYLLRADVLSGIGQYGVILIGIDDGKMMSEPVDGVTDGSEELGKEKGEGERDPHKPKTLFTSRGTDEQYNQTSSFAVPTGKPEEDEEPVDDGQREEASDHSPSSLFEGEEADEVSDDGETPKKTEKNEDAKKRKLLFLRVFGESLIQVTRFETNQMSPRFGLPVMYKITLNDPRAVNAGIGLSLATVDVHWTRVIHVNDSHENPSTSEWASPPRMQAVLNRLLDIRKISGAAGEGFWKNAFPILVMESNPAMGGDVDIGDAARLRDNLENIEQSLQKSLITVGFQAKLLPPSVTDPTPFIENCIVQICVKMGVPIRVFKGSERGELASSQDDATWNDRLRLRQHTYITPKIVIPFIDRLIAMGVLPKPKQGKRSVGQLGKMKLKGDEAAKPPGGDPMAAEGGEEGAPASGGFGGKPKPTGGGFKPGGPPKPAFNAFCPTGEGGGVDPSCSPSVAGAASAVRSLLDGMSAKTTSADVEAVISKVKALSKAEVDDLLPRVSITSKFSSKGKAIDRLKGALYSQLEMTIKAEAFKVNSLSVNSFCPTGVGGGVDPSCGIEGGGSEPMHSVDLPKNRKKLTVQHVEAALEAMGYKSGKRDTKKIGNKLIDVHHITHPDGRESVATLDEVHEIVYRGSKSYSDARSKVTGNSLLANAFPPAVDDEPDPALDQDEGENALTEDLPGGSLANPDKADQSALGIEAQEEPTTPGYSVEWPEIDSMTKLEKAQIFNQRVAAWAAYTAGGVDQIIPPDHAMTELDCMDEEEAAAILASAVQHNEEVAAEQAMMLEEHGFEPDPTNPDAMIDPDQQEAENEIELAKAENPAGVQQSSPFEKGPPGAGKMGGGPKGKFPVKNTENAFCATGEGGGVDPSCGKEDDSSAVDRWSTGQARLNSKGKPDPEGKFVETSLPKVKGKLIREALSNVYDKVVEAYGSSQEIDPTKVMSSQRTIDPDRVRDFVSNPDEVAHTAQGRSSNKLVVVKRGDEMAVVDGNHRLISAAIRGEKIKAIVVDYDRAHADAEKVRLKNEGYGLGIMKAADAVLKDKK